MTNFISELLISFSDIDSPQKIDENRQWRGVMDGKSDPNQAVFVAFYAGDSPPAAAEIQYEDMEETFWVYKTDYTVQELKDGVTTPQALFEELMFEQPNIEVAGLCKYVRDISS